MSTILVVDDNDRICDLIGIYLTKEGHTVLKASDGKEAFDIMENKKIDLIITDVMMPAIDGYELTESLRDAGYMMPILMITVKDSLADNKKGFLLGVDDYMTKPVDMEELVLRVTALLRRSNISQSKQITIQDVILDYSSLEVRTPEEVHELPKKEFFLLFKLLSYPNVIFTRQDLMDDIWGYDAEANERTVDVHVKRLREKLGHLTQFEIVTVRGLGYKGVIRT